jgi:glycosyltransferase involved in cell wall biosynthesis
MSGLRKLHGGSICLVTNDLDGVVRNSGIGTYFSLMAPLLARAGWRVHILYLGGVDDSEALARAPRLLAQDGIGFTALSDFVPPGYLRAGVIHAPWFSTVGARARHALEELHRIHHFDLIEFPDWLAFGFFTVQAKRSSRILEGARLCVKLHGTSAWQREGNHRWIERAEELSADYCERYAFEHAEVQMAPSQFMLEYVKQAGWNVRDDAVVAYPYPKRTLQVTWSDRASNELVFFGRLEFRKGLDIFTEALDDLPPEVPVTFLGRDTLLANGEPASEFISRRLAGRNFKILPHCNREQALQYLAGGERLAVIPSHSETFGFTVAECAVNGIPFIAARVGGIPEVADDDALNEQLLFAPNADDLAQRIRESLQATPAQIRRLRRSVQRVVDPEIKNEALVAKYTQLLEQPVAARALFGQCAVLATTGTNGPRRRLPDRRPTDHPLRSRPKLPRSYDINLTEQEVEDCALALSSSAPLATVAVTYYNLAEFLPATLAALAEQTYPNLEVLVVDDGSTSAIAARVFDEQQKRYPQFRFISQANGGPGKARNRALAEARGEFFLTVDADNIPRSDMVERFVEGMQRHGACSALTCHVAAFRRIEDIDEGRFEFLFIPMGGPHVAACFNNVYGDTNAVFRTADLRSVGGYETDDGTPFEDWETFVKLASAGYTIDVIPEPLFYYRLRGDNRSLVMTKSYTETFPYVQRIVKKFFAPGAAAQPESAAAWHYLAGIDAQDRVRRHLEHQINQLRIRIDTLLHVQDRSHEQRALIEQLSRSRDLMRYRAADRCVNVLRKAPGVHSLLRRTLPAAWRGWKAVSPTRWVKFFARR